MRRTYSYSGREIWSDAICGVDIVPRLWRNYVPVPTTIPPVSMSTVTIKLKLIGMDRAVNPDFLEAISRTNNAAEALAERYERAGPFICPDHPEGQPSIEVSAIFQSSVKVRQVKFCCQALSDQVEARMAAK